MNLCPMSFRHIRSCMGLIWAFDLMSRKKKTEIMQDEPLMIQCDPMFLMYEYAQLFFAFYLIRKLVFYFLMFDWVGLMS